MVVDRFWKKRGGGRAVWRNVLMMMVFLGVGGWEGGLGFLCRGWGRVGRSTWL